MKGLYNLFIKVILWKKNSYVGSLKIKGKIYTVSIQPYEPNSELIKKYQELYEQ